MWKSVSRGPQRSGCCASFLAGHRFFVSSEGLSAAGHVRHARDRYVARGPEHSWSAGVCPDKQDGLVASAFDVSAFPRQVPWEQGRPALMNSTENISESGPFVTGAPGW